MKARAWPCLPVAAFMLAGCWPHESDPAVATSGESVIRRSEVSVELRALLWRRGESWDRLSDDVQSARRREALDRCLHRLLLTRFAAERTQVPPNEAAVSEKEFQQFLKQFEPPEGWVPRLEGQGLSEMEMRRRIAGETAQRNAIESWLDAQRQAGNAPDENMARRWFSQHQPEFRIPEQANVSHIFLTIHDVQRPDRTAEINEISRRLIAREATFAALASMHSEDERSMKVGGALGWLTRQRLPEEFANQIFSVPLGEPSAPFRTSLGWHIILVHERKAARQPAFAEVKGEIMARLDQPWREQSVKQLLQTLREKAGLNINTAVLVQTVPAPAGM